MNLHFRGFVTAEVANRIRQATDGLVVEFLDKNPTAFVACDLNFFNKLRMQS